MDLILLSVTVFLLCLFVIVFKWLERIKYVKHIPGPPLIPLIGNTILFASLDKDKIQIEVSKMFKIYGDVFKVLFPDGTIINISHPDDVEKVINSNKNNSKGDAYKMLQPWLNEGLLVSNGSKWFHRRKLLTPTFHFNILRQFVDVMADKTNEVMKTIDNITCSDNVDLVPLMTEFTLQHICVTAMGKSLDYENDIKAKLYKSAVLDIIQCIIDRMFQFWLRIHPIYLLSQTKRRHDRSLEVIRNFTTAVINERRENRNKIGFNEFDGSGKRKLAMLDLMLSAEKENIIDASGILEEVETFMFEGHDTSMSALTSTLMLLANHQEVQERIYYECVSVLGNINHTPNITDLMELKYLECCLKEALRIYPSVPYIGRITGEDLILSGHFIPKGTNIHICIIDLHRRPDIWKNPEVFDPERFTLDNCIARHNYAYMPFSIGPRNCIGQKFAMLEMKCLVSAILMRYKLLPVTKPSDINLIADVILRPSRPVYVKFEKRQ